ncbi:MAG: hypothetical protein ABIP67_17135, partial [Burkholderiales bacterium]
RSDPLSRQICVPNLIAFPNEPLTGPSQKKPRARQGFSLEMAGGREHYPKHNVLIYKVFNERKSLGYSQ